MTTHRPLILGKPEPMPEELLRHVVASLANRDLLNLSAEMGRRLLADRDYHAQRAEAAEANYRFMVERATDGGRLDGYRELGQRAADAERERDEAQAEVARLRSRVRVDAEDVERAGVSWAKVRAWLERAGWSKSITSHGWRFKPEADSFTGVTVSGGAHERARAVTVIAVYLKRPDLDILDEMARMEVPA